MSKSICDEERECNNVSMKDTNIYHPDLISHLQRQASWYLASQHLHLGFTYGHDVGCCVGGLSELCHKYVENVNVSGFGRIYRLEICCLN